MPEVIVRPDDAALDWAGVIEFEHTPGWSRPWRLPFSRLDLFPADGLRQRAAMCAGVRIRFQTDSTTVGGVVATPSAPDELSPIDLVVDGEHAATATVKTDNRFLFTSLAAGRKSVELWLPQFGDFRLAHLTLAPGAGAAAAEPSKSRKIITYGSSITHCRSAASPARTWPAIVARELELDLTCLGYGGQAHLDPMVARMIGDMPADVITTCLGINVHGNGTFNARSFLPAVLGFLSTIRDGHPDTPILVVSPIHSPDRERRPGPSGLTLEDIREDVGRAVELLQRHGDTNVHLLNGLDVLGPADTTRLHDGLHPDAKGYEIMAERITPAVQVALQ